MKTCRAAAKRFRTTGSGKIRRRKANKNHLLQHKSSHRKRRLSQLTLADDSDGNNISKMLPYMK
ncbi:ribosomal protein L35 [Rubidibacter lacunae KORDI 51-2]|uniref:Large ribosomal subunit protein bL35 n=2 Tax=Rubidibacter TaxID=582491 RepID=U5DIH9_9CHRO|nr:ribosomal protein L35 [Rubidibacter lacunae KORDI 51-2]